MRLNELNLRPRNGSEPCRVLLALLAVFTVCSRSHGQQTFEFHQLGTADVLATMSVSGTPVEEESILSLTLLDPLDSESMADFSTLSLDSPISRDDLGLGGSSFLVVLFDVDRRPSWLDTRANSLVVTFQSEPDDDAILTCCFGSRTLAEGDWVVVVPEPSSQLLTAAAILSVIIARRRRLHAWSLRDAEQVSERH